ncbi:hypothetical protein ABZ234_22915 [Nocardiopsis sp. NPDC006198]|uniref:hypothetical protein n=1 Tax=Nocardiopsis sp. NPDC006198 TaxID=3154472 RepID=UPI0033B2D9E7
MTSPLPHPLPALTAALAAAALLAGCSAGPFGQGPAGAGATPSADAAEPSAEPSAGPAGPDLPEAADGTDLEACADAECEVLVEAGDEFAMDGTHGVDRFVVDAVDGEGLGMSGFGPGIELSGHLPPPDGGRPPTFVMNGFTVTLVAVDGSTALMALSP